MVTCKKAVVLCLAVLVGGFPVTATVDHTWQIPSSDLSPSIPLPMGNELGDNELLETEGEVAGVVIVVIGLLGWGALAGWVMWECRDHPGLLIAAAAVGIAGAGVVGAHLGGGGTLHSL